MIVDCAHYRDGRRQHEGPMELDRAAEFCLEDDGLAWLGLFEPDQVELGEVQERFGLHDLAVEDAQAYHLRPKIEQYGDGVVLPFFARPATSKNAPVLEGLESDVEEVEANVFTGAVAPTERIYLLRREGDRLLSRGAPFARSTRRA